MPFRDAVRGRPRGEDHQFAAFLRVPCGRPGSHRYQVNRVVRVTGSAQPVIAVTGLTSSGRSRAGTRYQPGCRPDNPLSRVVRRWAPGAVANSRLKALAKANSEV